MDVKSESTEAASGRWQRASRCCVVPPLPLEVSRPGPRSRDGELGPRRRREERQSKSMRVRVRTSRNRLELS